MAKITCVGQIWSFIHYRLRNQGLQEKAASQYVRWPRESTERGQATAKPPPRASQWYWSLQSSRKDAWDLQPGKFQKVKATPLLGVSQGYLFQLLTPPLSRPVHWGCQIRATTGDPLGGNDVGVDLCAPKSTGEMPCGRRFPQVCSFVKMA